MRIYERALVVGVAIIICGLAVGCKAKLNTKKGEKLIKENLNEQLGDENAVKSVKCPKSIEAKKGESFTCTAILADDTELTINVEQVNDDGNITWKPEVAIGVNKGEKLMKDKLPAMLNNVIEVKSVNCPDKIEAKQGATFTCTATLADDTKLRLDVVQKDDEGNIEWNTEPFLNAAAVANGILEEAKKNGVAGPKADCGKAIQPTELPATLDCTVTADGATSKVQFAYDKDGNVTTNELPQ